MRTLKNKSLLLLAIIVCSSIVHSCKKDDTSEEPELVGQDGNPRFNLRFNNEENVDLDLYVKTPNGSIIYYNNKYGEGGELDVDCLCGGCELGPNENIFWENGTAPSGKYEYWVDFYSNCSDESATSEFTIRVIRNGRVLTTKSGSLSSGQSTVWSHSQE